MKRKLGILLSLVLAFALAGASAFAMPIQIEEGTFSAVATKLAYAVKPAEDEAAEEAVDEAASEEAPAEAEIADDAAEPDGEAEAEALVEEGEYALDTDSFQLLGSDASGNYYVFAQGVFLKLAGSSLNPIAQDIGDAIRELPALEALEPLARGSRGEAVVALQQGLRTLSYLTGSADGDFGGQSARAITALQADLGFAETGEADALLQMLVASLSAEPIVIQAPADPVARFAALEGKTDVDLQLLADSGLGFVYDDIAGAGAISDGSVIAIQSDDGGSDIDQYAFEIRFFLQVAEGEDGRVSIAPAAEVRCECVRRPIMQELILKSGSERSTLAFSSLENGLSGAKSVEYATALLDAKTLELLGRVAENGELKLRVAGKYQEFDIVVPEENLAGIAGVARLGAQIG